MRKTLIASSLAALAAAGLAGGAVYASSPDASPGAAPTTTVGTDIFNDMGLTPEQGDCLVANVGGVDMNDLTALMELMTQCGISTEQLLNVGEDALAPDTTASEVTPTLEVTPPADIDPAAAAAVLELLELDATTVDCMVAEAEAAAPTDDATAEEVFITCGVGPLQVLNAIVALDAAAGDAVATAVDTATVTVAPTGSVVSSGNPMVDLLLEQLAAQGITLDAEQGQCLLDNISSLDPNDMTAMLSVFETCGINVADLIPGG